MIEMWADAYARKTNQSWPQRHIMLEAIDIVLQRMERNHQTPSGHLLAGTDKNHKRISWPGSNIELARCLRAAALQVPTQLAQRMMAMALKLDQQFFEPATYGRSASGRIDCDHRQSDR